MGYFVLGSISNDRVDAGNDENSVARDRQIGIRGVFLGGVVDPRIRLAPAVHP
jgi:hypothetical protein